MDADDVTMLPNITTVVDDFTTAVDDFTTAVITDTTSYTGSLNSPTLVCWFTFCTLHPSRADHCSSDRCSADRCSANLLVAANSNCHFMLHPREKKASECQRTKEYP